MRWIKRGVLTILVLTLVGLAAFLIFAPALADDGMNPVTPHDPYPVSDTAQNLHDSLIIGDWHADSLLWNRDLLARNTRGHVDLPRLRDGNVAIQVFTAVTKSPRGLNYEANATDAPDNITLLAMGQRWPIRTWTSLFERAIYQADKLHRVQTTAPEQLKIILNRADLDAVLDARAQGSDIVGGLLGIEGAHPLEGDIANLQRLQDAGYRLIGLQHFFDNALGGSLHGQGDLGLTDFGRQVVAQVEARNLILDVAHSSPQVVRDVLAMTDMPIVVSHTGIYGHCQTPRNIPDDLMQAVAAKGGVISIGYWADVTCDESPAGVAAAIMAAVDLVGVDHVSLGSDYDGTVRVGFDTSELAALTQALMDEGLNEAGIAAVMGGNLVRVMRDRLE